VILLEKGEGKKISDNVLLVLASMAFYKKPIEGRTRFQKIVYLLKKKFQMPFDFNFKPYYYGPYSEELSDLITFLTALKLVEEKTDYFGKGIIRYNYELTDKGKRYCEKFKESADRETLDDIKKLRKVVSELRTFPTARLISEAKSLMKN
jgi:uncharacterized protein YwgA